MAAGEPLKDLMLSAASIADELGFVALADLSQVLAEGSAECPRDRVGLNRQSTGRAGHEPGAGLG